MDRDSRNILIIIILATIFKGLFAAPLYLLDDEAYYWVWSRNLSLSYFDHPPMIAYFIRLSTLLFGNTLLGIRALGAISTGISIWFGLDLTYRIYRDKKVLWNAVWLYILLLPFFAAGTIITPDTPMLFFIALALWSFYRAAYELEKKYWWICGAAFGLALLSKYTAILWVGSVFLLLIIDPPLRHHLRKATPWLAGGLALLLFLPVVYWNSTHDWVSFRFQFSHGLDAGKANPFFYLNEFMAGQAGLITPGIFLLVLAVWIKLTRGWKTTTKSEKFLLITGVAPFIFFLYAGMRTHVEANWPFLAYFTAIIPVAVWHARAQGWQRWVRGLNICLMCIVLLIIILQAHFKILPLKGKTDPTNRYYGWPAALDQIEEIWRQNPGAIPVGNKYQLQSQLAYRLGSIHLPALNIGDRANHFDYFDFHQLQGRNILIISNERNPKPAKFEASFDSVTYLETITSARNGEQIKQLQVYLGKNYKSLK